MEEKEKTSSSSESSALYYGIGAAVLVLLVAGVYMLRPKGPASPTTPVGQSQTGSTGAVLAKPTSPITALACEIKYYNPVLGKKQYYLSVEGSDVTEAKTVDCQFSASVAKKVVAQKSVEDVDLKDEPARSGKTFRCTTEAVDLEPQIPTTVDIQITDDLKATATCSATFLFPTP